MQLKYGREEKYFERKKIVIRVTRLGEISPFGQFLKTQTIFLVGNMVGCRYFKSLEGI
jgi:hypothetical protein